MLSLQSTEEGTTQSVPVLSEIPANGGVITSCSVLQVEFEASSDEDNGQVMKVYRAFLSEAVDIVSSHSHCVDVLSLGRRLTAIVSTPFKINIESLIDKAAMINTIAKVVTKKAEAIGLPGITVKIGIDYGEAMLMRFGKYNPSEIYPKALAWMGSPITKASEMIISSDSRWNIWISGAVYQNLNEGYKKFFHHEMGCIGYGADIINTYMKNWLNNQ